LSFPLEFFVIVVFKPDGDIFGNLPFWDFQLLSRQPAETFSIIYANVLEEATIR
jgi:hypothetical protein